MARHDIRSWDELEEAVSDLSEGDELMLHAGNHEIITAVQRCNEVHESASSADVP